MLLTRLSTENVTTMPDFQIAPVTFAPLTNADLPMLHEWIQRPHVAEWWGAPESFAELSEDYAPAIAGSVTNACFIAHEGDRPVGFIQWYQPVAYHHEGWWLDEHDAGVRGIDQFLAHAGDINRGFGTIMIRAFVAALFADARVTRVQTDPSPNNARAIRCYEKCGFVRHAEVVTPDGPALVMYCDRPRY